MADTREIIDLLVEKYKYKPLPMKINSYYRKIFRDNIPEHLNKNGSDEILYTTNGTMLCNGYTRIVVGDYGAYVEFSDEQKANDFICKEGQEWRSEPKYEHCKYLWLTVEDDSDVKIYHQKHRVKYADYKPNMYYVSVYEVFTEVNS